MAEIRIEVKPALNQFTGSGHLYLVFVDDNNDEFVIRGGPENDLFPGAGPISVEAGIPIAMSDDMRLSTNEARETRGSLVLDIYERDPVEVWHQMVITAKLIDASYINYDTFGTNSNATVAAILAIAEIDIEDNFPSIPSVDGVPFPEYSGFDFGDELVGQINIDYVLIETLNSFEEAFIIGIFEHLDHTVELYQASNETEIRDNKTYFLFDKNEKLTVGSSGLEVTAEDLITAIQGVARNIIDGIGDGLNRIPQYLSQHSSQIVQDLINGGDLEEVAEAYATKIAVNTGLDSLFDILGIEGERVATIDFGTRLPDGGSHVVDAGLFDTEVGQAIKGAITQFAVTAAIRGSEFDSGDYAELATNTSIRSAISYVVQNNAGDWARLPKELTDIAADDAFVEGQLSPQGAAAVAAATAFAINLISNGFEDIEDTIVDTAVIGATTYLNSVSSLTFDAVANPLDLGVFKINPAQLAATFAAGRFAGEVVEPESEAAAVLGSLGSAYASAVGALTAATGSLSGSLAGVFSSGSLSTAFAAAGNIVPVIGSVVGAFIGQIAGTVIGNLFGGQDDPFAAASVGFDRDADQYEITGLGADDGGDTAIANSMAIAAMSGVNQIIEATGGDLRRGTDNSLSIGYDGDKYFVNHNGRYSEFGDSGSAIKHAALGLLQGSDLVGGHAIVMRAWHNSQADTLEAFQQDISVAEMFQTYLLNPAGILALMSSDPTSDAAQQWAGVLQRAAELELHLPHEKDFDGGWGELLAARGDINPESIPEITGTDIILTNPDTGEQIVEKHVIGPGYEIIRREGSDGDDTIEIKLDSSAVAYVDAGDGNDKFVGHDGVDIFVGGDGDDTA